MDGPKPLVLCDGKSFLWHLGQQLGQKGLRQFLVLTGYLTEVIEDYFGNDLEVRLGFFLFERSD